MVSKRFIGVMTGGVTSLTSTTLMAGTAIFPPESLRVGETKCRSAHVTVREPSGKRLHPGHPAPTHRIVRFPNVQENVFFTIESDHWRSIRDHNDARHRLGFVAGTIRRGSRT